MGPAERGLRKEACLLAWDREGRRSRRSVKKAKGLYLHDVQAICIAIQQFCSGSRNSFNAYKVQCDCLISATWS